MTQYLNTTNNIIVTAKDNGNGWTILSTEGTGLKNMPEQIETAKFNRYIREGAYEPIPEPDNRVFVILSPDHLEIHPEDSYIGLLAAKAAFTEWAKRFVKQGYYSSCRGRIALDTLESFCKYVPVEETIWPMDEEDMTSQEIEDEQEEERQWRNEAGY